MIRRRRPYVKLMVLLAARKTALVLMRWQDLKLDADPATWITPHEHTKTRKTASPRTYGTPLPVLAREIISGLPRTGERVFPTIAVSRTLTGAPTFSNSRRLQRALIARAVRRAISLFILGATRSARGWRTTATA